MLPDVPSFDLPPVPVPVPSGAGPLPLPISTTSNNSNTSTSLRELAVRAPTGKEGACLAELLAVFAGASSFSIPWAEWERRCAQHGVAPAASVRAWRSRAQLQIEDGTYLHVWREDGQLCVRRTPQNPVLLDAGQVAGAPELVVPIPMDPFGYWQAGAGSGPNLLALADRAGVLTAVLGRPVHLVRVEHPLPQTAELPRTSVDGLFWAPPGAGAAGFLIVVEVKTRGDARDAVHQVQLWTTLRRLALDPQVAGQPTVVLGLKELAVDHWGLAHIGHGVDYWSYRTLAVRSIRLAWHHPPC